MPSLPRSPFGRRAARTRAAERAPERDEPRVEIVEAPGLRWINIERPRPVDQAWLEERFEFHPLDYEDVFSRNQRPKVDEYDDYLFVVLHFPSFDKRMGRLNAAELDIFIGADYVITLPNEPLQPVEYLFERVRGNEEAREQHFSKGSGYLLYRIIDSCADASFPMLRKMGNNLERNKARYIPDDLDIFFDDINDAWERIWDMLENFKEVVEGLEGTNESVLAHRGNQTFKVLTAFSVILLPLTLIASIWGMNVHVPGQGDVGAFYAVIVVMLVTLG